MSKEKRRHHTTGNTYIWNKEAEGGKGGEGGGEGEEKKGAGGGGGGVKRGEGEGKNRGGGRTKIEGRGGERKKSAGRCACRVHALPWTEGQLRTVQQPRYRSLVEPAPDNNNNNNKSCAHYDPIYKVICVLAPLAVFAPSSNQKWCKYTYTRHDYTPYTNEHAR